MDTKRKKRASKDTVRVISEILALVLVVVLFRNRKLQLWLVVFAVGVGLSFFAGRFFCGWICPMGTLFRPIGWIYRKLGIRRLKTPGIVRKPWVRVAFLVLFVAVMVATKVLGIKVNALLYLILLSVALTLFFEEEMWHRYLCPFGTILSLSSRFAGRGMAIDEKACISCGKCQKVCPSQSIVTLENGKRANVAKECLLCYKCQDVCPVDVCNYVRTEKGAPGATPKTAS